MNALRWRLLALSLLGLLLLAAAPSVTRSDATTIAGVTPGAGGLAILDDASAAAIRATLDLEPGTDVQAYDADLTTYAGLAPSSAVQSVLDDASISAIQTTLGGGLGRVPVVHVAAGSPTTGDDSADGYAAGDIWSDTSGNLTYIADSVSVGAADWRRLLSPSAAWIYESGGTLYAVPATVDPSTGTPTAAGAAVAASASGTDYSESWASHVLTVPAGAASSGAVQSNSRRYSWSLSDLGLTVSVSEVRWASIRTESAALGDGGEARSGTCSWGVALGTAADTWIRATGQQRPSSGSGTYQGVALVAAGTSETAVSTASASLAGTLLVGHFGAAGSVAWYQWNLDSAGASFNNGTAAGAPPSGAPTHLILYLRRAGTTPSACTITSPQAVINLGTIL